MNTEPNSERTLADLGWSGFFQDQLEDADAALRPARIATVHRSRMSAETLAGPVRLLLPPKTNTTDFAVGDWVLLEPDVPMLVRRLDRRSLLNRQAKGGRVPQLIAANVDTLFIVTSCNDDFNPARLERYLALANEAGTEPVIVLTKADKINDATQYKDQALALQRGLDVVTVNAKTPDAATVLAPWCGDGQTVALVGSSGVGKSTLLNTLAGKDAEDAQLTGGIREDDAKGRHTTTSRSLHAIKGGGWLIDTPGMRTLHVADVSVGLDVLFAEITELAPNCRFRDCTHSHEPGCAVQAAVTDGDLDPTRLDRWRKLQDENRDNTTASSQTRGKRR
ncbi:ribosome biogenesis GTPase [Sulfitobacter marinus]|uniref:Small ribosomal subunit biogenesis GTPase RsgA n=1 Tax=Sulfitobacter marinus TaxID=394264 RepID=A0A1I6PY87_9RHOB|nr:ribosome small subunit-dependent GTPase A [Sulfitobacter marinus]SFS45189.1 ribosome biogenesis GTPase [Sulfitobacter marinus]